MDELTDESSFVNNPQPAPYAVQVPVALILMAIVAVVAVLPFFGFAAWIIAGPMLLVSFIMIIMVFSKGGVKPGLLLLFCQIIVMPVVVICGPVISSALGLTGAVGVVAVAANAADSSGEVVPAAIPYQPEDGADSSPAAVPTVPTISPVLLPVELQTLKEQIQTQQPVLQKLKSEGVAREAATGYLVPDVKAEIAARKVVLQENLWREQVFKQVAALTHQNPEQVAAEFARLAAAANR